MFISTATFDFSNTLKAFVWVLAPPQHCSAKSQSTSDKQTTIWKGDAGMNHYHCLLWVNLWKGDSNHAVYGQLFGILSLPHWFISLAGSSRSSETWLVPLAIFLLYFTISSTLCYTMRLAESGVGWGGMGWNVTPIHTASRDCKLDMENNWAASVHYLSS